MERSASVKVDDLGDRVAAAMMNAIWREAFCGLGGKETFAND